MGKVLGFIASIATIAVGLIVPGAQALVAAGIAQLAVATVNLIFGPKAPKTQAAETQIKNPTAPRVYGYGTRRVYGNLVFFGNTSKGATVDVASFVDGRAHAIRQAYINDEKVTVSGGTVQAIEKKYQKGRVKAGWNLGQTPAPVHGAVVSALPGIWTNNHRGDGVVSGYLIKNPEKEEDFLDTYPQGDNAVLSLVIDLQLCFDPRNPSHDVDNPDTWAWTENPVLQMLHYFIVRRGYSYEKKILPQIGKWIDAANICDEIVSGEKRYRGCVLYDSTAKPAEVIGSFLETFDGWYCENERGEIVIYAGKYYEPNVTIGPDQIVEYEHQSYVEDENVLNELTINYVSDQHDYNTVEAQSWRDETDIAKRGHVNSTAFSPQVPSYKQARRLAKINMTRNNTIDRGVIVTNYSGRIAENERFIRLQIEEAGAVIFSGVAEIERITRNLETHGLTIEWTRAEPNAWDWNPETEDGYGASSGEFPTIAPPDPPTIESILYSFGGEANTASLLVNGAGPDRDDLTWFARVREQGASAWEERRYNDAAPGPAVELLVNVVPTNTPLEVQISYKTGNGNFSGWSDSAFTIADTESEPPGDASKPFLVSWGSVLKVQTEALPRASSYSWEIYEGDGTTLIATRNSATNTLEYQSAQAAFDGARREYVFKVAGLNSAGAGNYSPASDVLSNPAPEAPANVAATGGDYIATITFDASSATDLSGYIIFYSKTAVFDPATTGFAEVRGNATSQQIYNLGAGTYYAKVAALDGWSVNPALLSLSPEVSFTINVGTESGIGGSESGGGSGGEGGGGGTTDVNLN